MSEAEGPWVEPEEAARGLLLLAPAEPGPGFLDELAAVLGTGAVVAFLVPGPAPAWRPARERCRELGVACLALDDPDLARELAADGVHLGDAGRVTEARRRLGPKALVGAACGRARHAAMVAGEEGADYVLFGPAAGDPAELPELCAWWSELFVLPCAADFRGSDLSPAELAAAGADFLLVRDEVWSDVSGAAAAAERLLAAIGSGRHTEYAKDRWPAPPTSRS